MKLVIQRVTKGSVRVDGSQIGEIEKGFVVLVGFKPGDDNKAVDKLTGKLLNLRIMADGEGKMNRSIVDVKGELLLVPQFTLYGDTSKGNRPSFVGAMEPEKAEKLFDYFVEKVSESKLKVETGKFGAMMKVELINDGPVTIILED